MWLAVSSEVSKGGIEVSSCAVVCCESGMRTFPLRQGHDKNFPIRFEIFTLSIPVLPQDHFHPLW